MATATAVAAGIAAAVYLDAKLGVTKDLRQLSMSRQFGQRLDQYIKDLGDQPTLYNLLVRANADADGLWFEGNTWSYRDIKEEVDSLAFHLATAGIKAGDVVSVFMTNSPEMVFTIYALSKIGAISGLVNSSLRDVTLRHCIDVAKSAAVICTPDLIEYVNRVQDEKAVLPCLTINTTSFNGIRTYEKNAAGKVKSAPPSSVASLAFLIYTSGTTGKPKACSIRALRICVTSLPSAEDMENSTKYLPTRIYTCMPLFHGTSIFTGLCYSVGCSGTLCLARKFSASGFWKDVHDSKTTRILYVGELCRYLLNTPAGPYDRNHNCIVATGNGLQKDVWDAFRARFNVPEIREYYRSTEGMAKYDNQNFNQWGAAGLAFSGPIGRMLEHDTVIVKYDFDKEDVYRDPKTGRCVRAGLNEAGEAVGRIMSMGTYSDYYLNPDATQSKIIHDVFEAGDVFQRSGDLIIQDSDGWIRFHDRIGDTFRWKGENVSAGEVKGFIAEIDNVADAIVFGVKLAKYEGQAGAASILLESRTPSSEAELMGKFYGNLKSKGVPSYAIPRLVRITDDMTTSATFKHLKNIMKGRAWCGSSDEHKDSTFWLDKTTYRRIGKEDWEMIEAGQAKL